MRVALVTGASSGIGAATARRLLEAGWRVAASGRDAAQLEALTGAVPFPGDLTDDAFVDALPGRVVAHFGALHGLVNAAGILQGGSGASTTLAAFDRTMDLNLRSVFAVSHAAIPHLIAASPSAIVNVSSVGGLRPFPGILAYCVSKAAVDQLTRCLAIELAASGVRVNAVNPGVVVTELHKRGGMSEGDYAAFLERGKQTHPLGRVGRPEEIAELIETLLSERTSWITGETIAIDGGRHLTAAR